MKSPKIKSIGEVVTDYGAKVMKVFKEGLLGRSLFDFYGDVKALTFKTKEVTTVPITPLDGKGGVIYTKAADGKLYYKSNEVSEVELSSAGSTLTTEQVQDIVGAMFSSNTETNITVTYQDADGTIDLVATDTNTQLTTEEVQDIVGAMFTSNTETRISATYEDADGTIDLVVDDMTTDTNTNVGNADMTLSGVRSIDTNDNTFQIKNGSTVYLEFDDAGIITFRASDAIDIGAFNLRALTLQSDVTTGTAPLTVASTTAVANLQAATATTLHTARNIGGVSFNGSANIDLPGVNAAGNQNTSGNAATATLATNAQGIAGATDADVTITSDGEVTVKLDSDNDESNQKFKITNNSDSVVFSVQEDGIVNMAGGTINIDGSNSNFELNSGSDIILEADNAGGGNSSTIQYLDAGGTNRIILGADSDVAILSNRASNGTVQIRANTATAGGSGEVTVVTVHDDKVDISQDLNVTGIITGKQREIYSQSFLDDLSTTKHYLPFKDINEQTTIYQEEAAMIMPCDGRIVSVTIRTSSLTGSGNMTIGVHTIGPNVNQFATSSWTEEETESLAISASDDYHVFHFAFSNAKHFESGDLLTISIQNDADLSGTAYWYVSTVVEYDWNTYLGTTSAEYDSNP
tara:strand:- start:802 stop:2706 length:1905 start_codon:yes stop_codon:yes gene_type:complete